MISLRASHRPLRENVVPMINVAFLLLVFFLLSATFVAAPPFEISPPEAVAGEVPDGVDVYLSENNGLVAEDGAALEASVVEGRTVRLRVSGDMAGAVLARSLAELSAMDVAGILLVTRPKAEDF